MRRWGGVVAIALLFSLFSGMVIAGDPYANETPEERTARIKWWKDAKFGMFIHWGVYSVTEGIHSGEKIPGLCEWIMHDLKIPFADYKKYAVQFNPVKYDPESWVRLAKEAGMKYIVITTKHHDGFALFDSKVTGWDMVDATPYGKDVLRPFVDACQKYGMKYGFYYSQCQDWGHKGGATHYGPEVDKGHWDPALQNGDIGEYVRNIAKPQLENLLTNYGDVSLIWWDTGGLFPTEQAEILVSLLSLKPGIIHNGRLGGGFKGDLGTPEQRVPEHKLQGDWETCMPMNDTWGYKSFDQNWKTPTTLIRQLVDVCSKGGNYLLNVGPTPLGEIPEPNIETLKIMGKWMAANGESIYETDAGSFDNPVWGRYTQKTNDAGTDLYAHVFFWPKDGKLLISGLDRNNVHDAYFLANGNKLEVRADKGGTVVSLPTEELDPYDTVIVLKTKTRI